MLEPARLRQVAQGGKPWPVARWIVGERRHRHQPRDRQRRAGDEVVELGGGDACLSGLLGEVDLDQDAQAGAGKRAVASQLAQRRLGRDRVDQTHMRHDQAHAPALQPTDEVPREQLAVRRDLDLQILGAVLAHHADPCLGEHG